MLGVMYPLIYEFIYNQKISVGAPFYNAIFVPITLLACIFMYFSIDSKWQQKLKIDHNYYLTNQIEKPVFQIFELVMKNPAKIIEDVVREQKNKKSGNASIKQWFSAMNKTATSTSIQSTTNKTENIETSILKKKIDYNEGDDEDNLLEGFEEEIKDLDTIEEN